MIIHGKINSWKFYKIETPKDSKNFIFYQMLLEFQNIPQHLIK